jgi:transposase, IS30 family
LSPSERRRIEQLLREGVAPKEIAREFGCSRDTVWRIRSDLVLVRRRVSQSELRLSFEERVEIAMRIARSESDAEIARALGRHRSTIGREVKRCCANRWQYRPFPAERRAIKRARRPQATKLAGSPRLLAEVERGLERRWSPRQISARLKVDHPNDRELRISPETIYQSLFVQGRGELRRQLAANLRSGRTKRRMRGGEDKRGRMADMVNISERPAEVEDRAVPGHWEGDLLIGKGQHSAVATLVERHTRYVLLAYLGRDRTTEHVIEALKQRIQTLPKHLVQSLTWDQGSEMAAHKQFSIDTGVKVYFCDPRSPWQRGSNENTNGLLRQYLPKSADLAARSQVELDHIAAELNGRPRQTLDWATPAERMQQLLLR